MLAERQKRSTMISLNPELRKLISKPTSTNAPVTEGELFGQFLESRLTEYGPMGTIRWRHTVRDLLVLDSDLLMDVLKAAVDEAADEAVAASDVLEHHINILETTAGQLRQVRDTFDFLRREQVIETDDDQTDWYLPLVVEVDVEIDTSSQAD
jgi:hypothetical protein